MLKRLLFALLIVLLPTASFAAYAHWEATATSASDPNIKPDQKFESVNVVLNAAQRNALVNFVNANLVPVANAQEEL